MRVLAVIFLVVLFTWPSKAQETAISATVIPHSDGSVDLAVTDHSRRIVTAWVIFVDFVPLLQGTPRATQTIYTDNVINPFDRPLMPNDTRTVNVGGTEPGSTKTKVEVGFEAALFDDGSAFGDPSWSNRLVQQRKYLYVHIQEAIELLDGAKPKGTSREDLINQMQSIKKTKLNSAETPEEQRAIRKVYEEAAVNLQRSQRPDGTVIPVSDRIDQIEKQFVQERQRILASKPPVTDQASQ